MYILAHLKEASLGFWEFLEALGEGLVHPEITCLFLKLNVITQQASHSGWGGSTPTAGL